MSGFRTWPDALSEVAVEEVCFHVPDGARRAVARILENGLEDDAVIEDGQVAAPGIGAVETGPPPSAPRGFSADGCGKAEPYIAEVIGNRGVEIKLADLSDRGGDSDSMPPEYLEARFASLPELGTNETATSTAMGQ